MNEKELHQQLMGLYKTDQFEPCLNEIYRNDSLVRASMKLLVLKGASECQLGKYQDALSTYNSALELDSRSFDAWNNKGFCAEKLNDKQLALSCYLTAYSITPGRIEPFKAIFQLLKHTDQFEVGDELVNKFQYHIESDSTKCEIIGSFYLHCNQPSKAQEFLDKSLLNNPKNINALNSRALLHVAMKEEARAIELLTQLLKCDHKNSAALLNIGIIYKRLGQYDKAIDYLLKLKRKEPDNTKCRMILASTFLLSGDYSAAWEDYLFCSENGVDTPQLYYDMGNCKFLEDDFISAMNFFEKCLSLDPEHRDARFNLGVCQTHVGDFENSKLQYEKVIELDPSFAEAYRNLVAIKNFKVTPSFIQEITRLENEETNENNKIFAG